jgi:ribosome assembly protein 1
MFVQLILENIWSVYEAIVIRRFVFLFDYKKTKLFFYFSDNEKLGKIATSIGAKLTPRDIAHTDPYVPLHLLFNQWLPVASAVFG